MRDLVRRSSVRNAIYMMRQVDRQKTVLIVEGDSDSRSFSRVVRASQCKPFSPGYPGGKEQAIALFNDLKQTKLPGVAALVDADCDRFWNRSRGNTDILWTSGTDREVMIIESPAFGRFVTKHFTTDVGQLRTKILEAAFPMGCLRLMSRRMQWALDFKNLEIKNFIEASTIACDEQGCCNEILAKNLASHLDTAELLSAIQSVRQKNPALEDVACGHDACQILSVISGPHLGKSLSYTQIEYELAECYEPTHFAETSTYTECSDWEGRNQPFLINI